MTTIELKLNLYNLIENTNDKNTLSGLYKILIKTKQNKIGLLWDNLSKDEQFDLEELARQKDSDSKLISNEDVLKKYQNNKTQQNKFKIKNKFSSKEIAL